MSSGVKVEDGRILLLFGDPFGMLVTISFILPLISIAGLILTIPMIVFPHINVPNLLVDAMFTLSVFGLGEAYTVLLVVHAMDNSNGVSD